MFFLKKKKHMSCINETLRNVIFYFTEREKMENWVYFAEEVNPVFSLVALVGRVLVNTCKKYWNSAKQPLGK